MKILLVEDNIEISENISRILKIKNSDFNIIQAFDGEEAIKNFLLEDFDIILLDLMIPKIDGMTLCKRIRLQSKVPIIIMTALGDDDNKILGLENGADDYIVKPFKVEELYLRILNIIKRLDIKDIEIIGNIEINFDNKTVKKDNEIISLKLKEFEILEIILKKKTISRTELVEKIWGSGDLFGNENKLDVYIYSIRKLLGKDIIKTIKGFGYSIKN
ncbi:MAG: response regulator transcription factor [Candidatus Gracilibacteria bacterium]|nr:response regulator transcription factor [Candidatus Gracilibacteria bacterium]MDQ7023830.1 response regulator transcription factor [Candidatus Gracilibacteria bacterium]